MDCQTSLQVMMMGCLVSLMSRTSSGMPPLSEPVTPSTSSINRIFPLFLKRDCCWLAGLRRSSNWARFLKSEAFNSRTSRSNSFAAANAMDVFPVPAGPWRRRARFLVFGKFWMKSFIVSIAVSWPTSEENEVARYFSANGWYGVFGIWFWEGVGSRVAGFGFCWFGVGGS